jgi:hypothetical protein
MSGPRAPKIVINIRPTLLRRDRWSETFGKGAPRRQASEILSRFRKFLPPPLEVPVSLARGPSVDAAGSRAGQTDAGSSSSSSSSGSNNSSSSSSNKGGASSSSSDSAAEILSAALAARAAADAAQTLSATAAAQGPDAGSARRTALAALTACPRNGLANDSAHGWRWRHPLRAPLPFHVSAGGAHPLGRAALKASLANAGAVDDARLQRFFRKVNRRSLVAMREASSPTPRRFLTALPLCVAQALRGEPVTVVVLGGSMTAGHAAGHPYRGEEAWAARRARRNAEPNGGCWLHCAPGHASSAAWPQKVARTPLKPALATCRCVL